jgi:hypothetical protein
MVLDFGGRGALLDTNSTRANPPFNMQSDFFFDEPPSQFGDWTVGASVQIADASASLTHSSSATSTAFQADVTVASSVNANPGAYNEFLSFSTSSFTVNFTLEQSVEFVLGGDLFASGGADASIRIIGFGGAGVLYNFDTDAGNTAISESFVLGAGSYSFRAAASSSFQSAVEDASGSAGFAFTFLTVPGPSCLVPLAVMLCVPARRR